MTDPGKQVVPRGYLGGASIGPEKTKPYYDVDFCLYDRCCRRLRNRGR